MRKYKVIGASILLILSMISITISATEPQNCETTDPEIHGHMEVIKEAYIGEGWTEGPITPQLGETVEFRITIIYHNSSGLPKQHWAYDIRIYDELPDCLDYVDGTADPSDGFTWSDDPDESLYWDLGDLILLEEESYTVKYNATAVLPTDQLGEKNNVTVIWDERCTYGRDLEHTDFLIVIVSDEPQLMIEKEVWDSNQNKYVKTLTAYEGETLRFKIDVNNPGSVDLTNVIVNDTYPDFITPFEYSIAPTAINTVDRVITWNLGILHAGESKIILFNATVNPITDETMGKNFANVTCDEELSDTSNVTILLEKHFEVDKKVKHPDTGEWVEEIPYVKGCEPVRFRIKATYMGENKMKCALIYDQLPIECLEYADNVYVEIAGEEITTSDLNFYPEIYTAGETFTMCSQPQTVPEGGVYFSWVEQTLGFNGSIKNGESIIIEFDANVVEYCEDGGDCCVRQNCAEAWLWSCCDFVYYDMDCVDITCIALPGEFEKTGSNLDPTSWTKELYTVQGKIIKFKLEMTYYGNENLTNVTFKDVLPCCLEYKDTIEQPSGTDIKVSTDKKTIIWNVTKQIADCETVTIIFRADVTGSSECGGCINNAYVYGYIYECLGYNKIVDRSDSMTIYVEANSQPYNPDVSGPQKGVVGVSYSFKSMLDDPNGDQMYYKFDFDGQVTEWLGPVGSGEVTEQHTFTSSGTYEIRVKAKDEHDAESGWTQYPWEILIETAEVEIEVPMFNFDTIEATVKNTGDADLTNVNYEFIITRDSFISIFDIDLDGSGTIANLPSGSSANVNSESVGFKFGLADLTVKVTKPGVIEPTDKIAKVFFIGPVILVF